MKKKKIIRFAIFIVIVIAVIGTITSCYSAKMSQSSLTTSTKLEGIDVGDANVNIELKFDRNTYNYLIGEDISIGPSSIKLTGINLEGDHPDKLVYNWQKVIGGRPYPIVYLEDQTSEKLTYNSAVLNNNGNYVLEVTCQRWNPDTGTYEYLIKGEQKVYAASGYISVNVYPDLNSELVTDDKLSGDNDNGYNISLQQADQYKLNLNLYRYELQRTSRTEEIQDASGNKQKKTIIEWSTTNNKVAVNSNFAVNWTSSADDIVEVSSSGNITVKAYSTQPVTITSTIIDKFGITPNGRSLEGPTITVNITKIPVQSIEIKSGENTITETEPLTMKIGETTSLTAVVKPDLASYPNVTWSVEESPDKKIDIDENGTVTASKEGEAIVTAKADGVETKCRIIVQKVPVQRIITDRGDELIYLYQDYAGTIVGRNSTVIHAEVYPTDATNKKLIWSIVQGSDNIKIDDDGNGNATVSALKFTSSSANYIIKVYSDENNDISQEFTIKILSDYRTIMSDVMIEPDLTNMPSDTVSSDGTVNLDVDQGIDFNLKLHQSDAQASYDGVEWSIIESNPINSEDTVITIDQSGYVTAKNPGTATIKMDVKCQNPDCPVHSATQVINVKPIQATSVTIIGSKNINVLNHESVSLSATVMPETTTFKTIEWKSENDSIAKVSADGTVTAMSPGTVKITASCGEASDYCMVTVDPIKVEYLIINKNSMRLKDDGTDTDNKLTVTCYPSNADNKQLVWKIEDPSIVRIEDDGTVVPLKVGETDVVISVKDDPTVEPVTCKITILPSSAEVIVYTVDQKGKFLPGFTLRLSKVDENGREEKISEISGRGKFDFGVLADGKYTISEIVIPETDVDGNEIDVIQSIGFFHFEIEYGAISFLNGDNEEYPLGGLVIVNVIDYPGEEEEQNAYIESGHLFTTDDNKTIEDQFIEFEKANFEPEPEEPDPENPEEPEVPGEEEPEDKDQPESSETNDDTKEPKTSDKPIEFYAIAMVVSFIVLASLKHKRPKAKRRK